MREISCINYMITTKCNQSCPDCCCDIPNKKNIDVSWEYLEDSAKYFKGIDRINLTGGEPTFHHKFEELVPKLSELFQCKYLTVETNGYGFVKFPEIFNHFDWIQISHYTTKTYKGSLDNQWKIEYLRQYIPEEKLKIGEIIHMPRNNIPTGNICERGLSETISYADGLLYPCCVAFGIKDSKGIELTDNWKQEILEVPLPCNNCLFSN